MDLSGNYSPVWLTTVFNTTVYIDYDSDPTTGSLTDSLGNHYDTNMTVSRLTSSVIYNPNTNDQTRMRLYTLDGTYLTAAWGSYPANPPTPPGGAALDENGCNIGSLGIGEEKTVSYILTINASFPLDNGVLVNSAYAGSSEGQWQDVDPVRIEDPSLSLEKSSSATNPVAIGDTITYTLTVKNDGSHAQSQLRLTEELPAGLSYVPNTVYYVIETNQVQNKVRDDFDVVSYSNNNGTADWSGDWSEIGESDGASSGFVAVSNSLSISSGGRGVSRAVDLSGYSNALLRLTYKRDGLDNANEWARCRIATNTNGTWTTLGQYADGTDAAFVSTNYDITSYMSSNTTVSFWNDERGMGNGDYVWFDDVKIAYGEYITATNIGGSAPNLASGYTLPAGKSITVTFDAEVDDFSSTQIVNEATVSAFGILPVSATVTDSVPLPASIGDQVWVDFNGDDVRDPLEMPLIGVRVFMDANSNGVFDTSELYDITDTNGEYLVENLIAGSYRIMVDTSSLPGGVFDSLFVAGTSRIGDAIMDSFESVQGGASLSDHYVLLGDPALAVSSPSIAPRAAVLADTMSYDEWHLVNFAPAALAAESAEDADPNGDGISNRMAYMLGLSAVEGGDEFIVHSADVSTNAASADVVELRIWKRRDTTLRYRVKACVDLRDPQWQDAVIEQIRAGRIDGTMEEVILEVKQPNNSRRAFMCVVVSENQAVSTDD